MPIMYEEPQHNPGFDISPLFVGLLGILCGAVIVATFHCVAMGWCSSRQPPPPPPGPPNRARMVRTTNQDRSTPSTNGSSDTSSTQVITVYKCTEQSKESTCAVCLSEFVEGEEVRVLSECGHLFHVPCIDMWIHSHPSCPICRAGTMPPPPPTTTASSLAPPVEHVVVV